MIKNQILRYKILSLNLVSVSQFVSFLHLDPVPQVINYDLASLVADIGGTLGLFVGFSFFSLWDTFKDLALLVKRTP